MLLLQWVSQRCAKGVEPLWWDELQCGQQPGHGDTSEQVPDMTPPACPPLVWRKRVAVC
jgi:hypothetical protein